MSGNQLTVTCWIRCIDFADTFQRVIVKGTALGDPASTWFMFSLATGQTVRFRLKTTAGTTGYISLLTLDLATWHHLALVYDGAEMRFYIDAVLDQVQSKTGDLDSTDGIPIVIGAQAPSGGSEFAGQIDDVRFYRTALTAEEISELAGVEGADLTPPTVPSGLSVSVLGPTSLLPDWSASTDAGSGVLNYDVERNGSIVAVVPAASTFYHDQGLTPSTQYSYRVRARDVAGNLSAYSAAVLATTDAESSDVVPPTVPGSLTAESQGSDSILVDWAASTDTGSGVLNYDVERNGSIVATIAHPTTEYLDEGLTPSTSYTYRVRARDVSLNVSAYTSSVVEATGAAPPPDSGEDWRSEVVQSITTSGRTFEFRFTFDKPYWTGRFVTGQNGGDWWVIPLSQTGVEPHVRIISVTPAYVDLGGGHMQNGSYLDIDWLEFQSKQPFANPPLEQDPAKWNKDTTAGHITNIGGSRQYDAAMRLQFPVNIVPNVARGGTTVVHCRSKAGLIADRGHGPEEKFSRPFTNAFCVLSVLPAAPAPGSFRPTWAKHTKTIHNISQVRKSLISNLRLANPGPSSTGRGDSSEIPTLASLLSTVSATWLDYMGKQTTAQFTAAGDKRQYHGPCLFNLSGHDPNDININAGRAYLRLLLDRTAGEEATWDAVLYNLIQIGIDYYGWVMTGATWGMTTGHQGSGLAFNIHTAGVFLNSAPMMSITGDTSIFPGTSFPSNHVRFHEIMKTTPFIEDMRAHGYTTLGYPSGASSPGKWPELIPATIPTTLYRGTNWPRIVQCDQKHGISAGAGIKYNGSNWRSYVAAGTLDSWLGFCLFLTIISDQNPAVDARGLFGHEPVFLMTDDAIDRLKFSLVTVRSQSIFIEMMWDAYRSVFDTMYPVFAQAALPSS